MSDQPIMLGNRYRLDEVIGRGGMAEVWRAWDTRLGRDVAVKRLRVDLATDPTFQARFQREAQSAAGLNHPNIVAVYDTGAELDPKTGVDIPFIVMELVQGTTLRDLLRDGRQILPERSLEFTAGVLDALAYSHRRGIVHRDIKPGNVMLTTTGRIKVMDFGIARAVSETSATMTQTAAVIGTAQYLSPEQARGETVDARSDIYSVGCLLYELLTSRPPFIGDSPVSVAYQHVREQPIPPSRIDPELTPEMDTVVLTALAKDPADRYQTAQAMRDDIQRLLDGNPPVGAGLPSPADVQSTRVLSDRLPPGAHPKRGFTETHPMAVAGSAADYDVDESDDEYPQDDGLLPEDNTGGSGGARSHHVPVLVYALIGLVIVLLTVGGFVLHAVLSPPPVVDTTAVVPYVKNMDSATAEQTIRNAKLVPDVQQREGPAITKGLVLDQDPQANEVIQQGLKVTIWVNSGPTLGVVPDVTGMTESAARQSLAEAGFTNVPAAATADLGTDTEPNDYVAGQVLSSSPDADTQCAVDTPIQLTLATGKSQVPDLSGLTQAQAKENAAQVGFQLSVTKSVVNDPTCLPNTVYTNQKPAAGTYEFRKNKIFITICLAPVTPTTTEPTDTSTDEPG